MLSSAMVDQLNEPINLEFYSSNLSLQMSAWCSGSGRGRRVDIGPGLIIVCSDHG